jgi:hypothetical protein
MQTIPFAPVRRGIFFARRQGFIDGLGDAVDYRVMETQQLEQARTACFRSRKRALLGLGVDVVGVDHDAVASSDEAAAETGGSSFEAGMRQCE